MNSEGKVLLADHLRLEVSGVSAVHHHHLVLLGQVALQSRLGGPGDAAAEARPVARPPEGVTLAVLLGKHQQHLEEEEEEQEVEEEEKEEEVFRNTHRTAHRVTESQERGSH